MLVFPKTCSKYSNFIKSNAIIFINGKLNLREETLKSLKNVLAEHPGITPVYLNFIEPNGKKQKMLIKNDIKVKAEEALLEKIEKILGQDAVTIQVYP